MTNLTTTAHFACRLVKNYITKKLDWSVKRKSLFNKLKSIVILIIKPTSFTMNDRQN